MDELRLKIQHLRKFPSQEGPRILLPFVPEADLFSLLSRGTVTNALADAKFQLKNHQRGPVADEVVDGARKIFAILVELRLVDKLKKCLEKCLTDSSLPVLEGKRLGELFPESATHFEKLQWEYIPLKFREGAHKDLESGRILPYVKNTKMTSGGFSTIFNITIHPSYQDWHRSSTSSGIELVRKEVSPSTSYEAQRRESELLFLLRSLQNENIVQLVTSYTQNGFCNLLFPVADCDLHDLLLSSQQPEWTKRSEEVIDSLHGLADGLHYLHNFRPLAKNAEETERITKHGYHHDIKPRNILVHGSRLILADFGLSRLKDAEEDTQTVWKHRPPTYSAPEACDPVTLQERSIGRAYDIWSFGCVLSEVATYALEGAEAVKTFRKEREKEGVYGRDNCFHQEGVTSPAVSAWFRKMEDCHSSSSLCLLFEVSSKLLVGDPNERPRSDELVQEFDYLSLSRRLQSVLRNTSIMRNEAGRENISTVYLAKLTLERNRLRAWGYALGIESFNQKMQPWIGHTSENYHKVHLDLKSCDLELVECMKQTNQHGMEQRILAVLTSTNEALLLGLPESVKNVVENIFELLTVSTAKNVPLFADLAAGSQTLAHMGSNNAEEQNTSRHREAGLLAAARYLSLMLNAENSLPADRTFKMIEPSLICDGPPHDIYPGPLSVRWYYQGFRESDKQRVLVEERSYDSKWMSVQDENEFAESGKEIFERIKELAKLFQMQPKPKRMRLLNCLGVFHLPAFTRFGFVYEFPPSEEEGGDQKPISLSDVIQHTKDPERNLTLNDKFALSQSIASCIYSLHLTGWLHKSIRSSNLIYFIKQNQNLTSLNICEPYLVGFQQSRQSGPGAYSNGSVTTGERAFVHPSYQDGVRFHSAFDYYSLGVILLEIALWRPINKALASGSSADALRLLLLEYATKYVPKRMGTGYCEVVVACLNFYHHDNSEERESGLLMKFQQEVLEKLQRASLPL